MIFYILFAVKNSYVIHILFKNCNFFWRDIYSILYNFIKKYKCYTWIDLKIEDKNSNWKFYKTKNWIMILEELKWKVDIFIKIKNIFSPIKKYHNIL